MGILQRGPFDQEKDEPPEFHWGIDLLDWERERLLTMLEEGKRPVSSERRYIAAHLKDAIRRDGSPLPVAQIDWRREEARAKERGGSLAEWIYDDRPSPPDLAA